MDLKNDFLEFEKEIDNRGIEYLIHFTPTINLLSIYNEGKILSRKLLELFDVDQTDIFDYVQFTDDFRFDDKSYINLSVQHPNSYLFNRFRQKTIEENYIFWCVLKINKKYIYKADTLFSVTNAANKYNKNNIGVSGDLKKFQMLFTDPLTIKTSYGSRILNRDGLPVRYPTDEQAEILVKDEIPLSEIIEVSFEDESNLARGKAALSEYNTDNFKVDAKLFTNIRA